jgi:hypothetical protein
MKSNNITLDNYKGITVLRDDLLIGGTKSRFLHLLLDKNKDGYVYASPVYGGFQIALSGVAKSIDKESIIFCAGRSKKHYNTIKASELGSTVVEIRPGYLSVVQKRAKDFVKDNPNYQYLEFGANYPDAITQIAKTMVDIINELGKEPSEIYCAVGSGTLVKGILAGTTSAKVTGVMVGKEFNYQHERLRLIKYPKGFDYISKYKVPFQSMPNYDLKALEVCMQLKRSNDVLFWNVY